MIPLNEVSMKQAVEFAKGDAAALASAFAATAHGFTSRTPKALRKRYALECRQFVDLLDLSKKVPAGKLASVPVEVRRFIEEVSAYLTEAECELSGAQPLPLVEAEFSDAERWNEVLRWKRAALVIARAHFATLKEMPERAPASYRRRAEATCTAAIEFLGGLTHAEVKSFGDIEIKNAIDRCRTAAHRLAPPRSASVREAKAESAE